MEERKASLGPVGGMFSYKKLSDGSLDKSIVVCMFCDKEFAYHGSTSSLRYHLNAKHFAASLESSASLKAKPGWNRRCLRSRVEPFAEFGARMGKSDQIDQLGCTLLNSWITSGQGYSECSDNITIDVLFDNKACFQDVKVYF